MKKTICTGILTAALIMSLAACGGAPAEQGDQSGGAEPAAEKFVFSVATTPSEASPEGAWANTFKSYVEEKSGGRVEVQLYLAAQMGTDRDILEGVQFGNIIVGGTGITQWTNFVPELNVLDGPFVVTKEEMVYSLFEDGEFNNVIAGIFEKQGYHYLGEHFLGFRLMTSNNPMESMADFAGTKIRVIESPTPIALWSALGANPTPIAFTEVYTALQQGTVDAQENPITNIYDKKFYEQQDYIINTNHQIHTDFWAMNLAFYNSLPADLQQIVDEGSKAGIDAAHQYAQEQYKVQIAEMEEFGCEVLTPSDAFMQEMITATESVRTDIQNQYPDFYQAVTAALDRVQ